MKKLYTICLILFSLSASAQWNYPVTKTSDTTTNYFGTAITDHYRWLEKLDDKEVQGWFKKQADLSAPILAHINGRDSLFHSFVKLNKLKGNSYTSFVMAGNTWFYKITRPGEKVASLYYRNSLHGKQQLLLNPLAIAKGHVYSIAGMLPSPDGKKVAIGLTEGGAEIATIRILNVTTKKLYKDQLPQTIYGFSDWLNNNALIYTAQTSFDKNSLDFHLNTKSMLHVLGTNSKTDRELFSKAKYGKLNILPEDVCYIGLDNERKYMVGFLGTADNATKAYYAPVSSLAQKSIPWKVLFKTTDGVTNFLTRGNDLYMLTFKDALHFKITKTSIANPDIAHAAVILKESKKKIENISIMKDQMLITQSDGINSNLISYNFHNGAQKSVGTKLQGDISIAYSTIESNTAIIDVSSWIAPRIVYELNITADNYKKSVFNTDITYPGMADLRVKEVEAPAADGTMVPLSIIYDSKKVKMDGNNSCILTGYGCYAYSFKPGFNEMNLALLQRGVVLAYAHVRGGGEKGEDWHLGGYKTTKPNTWKDFIACGEYLVKEGYTRNDKLAGTGTSAGGILISRAITDRPDLFAAAVCNVGDANALRSEYGTDGPANSKEYGTDKDSVECKALIAMDGLSHVKKGTSYPALLCATGINDPRVAPWQPGKFAAAVQGATASGKPVLLRVDYDNGHFTEDHSVTFNNFADQFSFMLWQTGHPDFQPADSKGSH